MPDQKCVCYCMTRNIYRNILPSMKSLLKNGNVDHVYLLIEDDDVGFWLPENITCVNVKKQAFFPANGPNYNCRWTYMVMMRTVLCHIFPDLHRILSLDLDTIVTDDISGLWNIPLGCYCLAGARERYRNHNGNPYVNCGVVMWNLDMMRHGWSDKVVNALNAKTYDFAEQDCVNEILSGRICLMDSAYNWCDWTVQPQSRPKIHHYAAWGTGRFMSDPMVSMYRDMNWEEVLMK